MYWHAAECILNTAEQFGYIIKCTSNIPKWVCTLWYIVVQAWNIAEDALYIVQYTYISQGAIVKWLGGVSEVHGLIWQDVHQFCTQLRLHMFPSGVHGLQHHCAALTLSAAGLLIVIHISWLSLCCSIFQLCTFSCFIGILGICPSAHLWSLAEFQLACACLHHRTLECAVHCFCL